MNTERIMKIMSEALENQLRDNKPMETKQTLERLMASGNSEAEAKGKILVILTEEMFEVIKNKKEFDQKSYIAKLEKLN